MPQSKREQARHRPILSWDRAKRLSDAPRDGTRLVGVRALIVEDDDDSRDLLAAMLESEGCVVFAASSARQALEHLSEARFDIIISDIGMPGEDGYSLMRKVRAREQVEGGDTPSIALTAFTRPVDQMHAREAGFSAHLPKPVLFDRLFAAIHSLTRRDN